MGSSEEVTNTDNVWLDSTTIRTRRKNTGIDLTDLTSVLGSGDAIGSLVGNMVHSNTKLQRIVTQCGCDFYYASFNDELEDGLHGVPASITVSKLTKVKHSHLCIHFFCFYKRHGSLLPFDETIKFTIDNWK